jgi:hypothetical protein
VLEQKENGLGLRTASACGVVLRLDGRRLKAVGVNAVGVGGVHVACASSAVRHAALVAGLIVGFGALQRVHGVARGVGWICSICSMRCDASVRLQAAG